MGFPSFPKSAWPTGQSSIHEAQQLVDLLSFGSAVIHREMQISARDFILLVWPDKSKASSKEGRTGPSLGSRDNVERTSVAGTRPIDSKSRTTVLPFLSTPKLLSSMSDCEYRTRSLETLTGVARFWPRVESSLCA